MPFMTTFLAKRRGFWEEFLLELAVFLIFPEDLEGVPISCLTADFLGRF